MKLEANRLVLVHSPRDQTPPHGKNSSGYLIGDGIVLTALHGLVELDVKRGGQDSIPGNVVAQVWLNQGDEWLDARMIWPDRGTSVQEAADVAVLRIDRKERVAWAKRPLRMDIVEVQRNDLVCACFGYPMSWRDPKDEALLRASPLIRMATDGFDDGGNRIRKNTWLLHVQKGAPENNEHWSGLSGALVVCDDPEGLVGIIREREEYQQDNSYLGYESLAALRYDRQFWIASGLTPPQGDFDILKRLKSLGRSRERDRFGQIALTVNEPPEHPAQLVLVTGHKYDDVNQCIQNLADYLTLVFPTQVQGTGRVVQLGLGDADQDVDERERLLAARWLKELGLSDREIALTKLGDRMNIIRARMELGCSPRIILMEHIADTLGPRCEELAKRVTEVVVNLPKLFPPCFVFVGVLTGNKADVDEESCTLHHWPTKLDSIEKLLRPALRIDLNETTRRSFDLSLVEWLEIQDWLTEIAGEGWRPTSNSEYQVRRLFDGNRFPMAFTVARLKALLTLERG